MQSCGVDPAVVHGGGQQIGRDPDIGFVGEPGRIKPEILNTFIDSDVIPVIAPIGVSATGETSSINADTEAGAFAGAMNAKRLLHLTDVEGVVMVDGRAAHSVLLELFMEGGFGTRISASEITA